MRILFTSVGRRVELMQAFHAAGKKLDIPLEIYGADITETAPALQFCDHAVMVPRISDPSYIPELQAICRRERIDALVPTIDTDLQLLADHRDEFTAGDGQQIGDNARTGEDRFHGTKVFIASPEKIRLCRDKRYTADYFHSLGLKSPQPVDDWRRYTGGFPAFIKPKDGSSSINAYKIDNKEELYTMAGGIPDYIIQPYVSGTEYTVDIFCDYDGDPVYITPRIRLAVRAGEVLKTKMTHDRKIIEEMKVLVRDFRPRGQITVQLIRDKTTGEDWYIEINPRFGGGAPLSIKAGADSAEALLRVVRGEKPGYHENAAIDGAVYSRFDQSVRVE